MNWKTLKNRYPEIWEEVYSGVLTDVNMLGINETKTGTKEALAHNAAFLACDAVRKNKYLVDINRK